MAELPPGIQQVTNGHLAVIESYRLLSAVAACFCAAFVPSLYISVYSRKLVLFTTLNVTSFRADQIPVLTSAADKRCIAPMESHGAAL